MIIHYHHRWEVETSFFEIKTRQCARLKGQMPTIFRSKTSELVEQELYAMLIAYNLLRDLIYESNTQSLVPEIQPSLAESDVQESSSSVQIKKSADPENLQHDDEELQGKQADIMAQRADYLQQYDLEDVVNLSHVQAYIGGPAEVACKNLVLLLLPVEITSLSGNNLA